LAQKRARGISHRFQKRASIHIFTVFILWRPHSLLYLYFRTERGACFQHRWILY
jgi:hypothetical protein